MLKVSVRKNHIQIVFIQPAYAKYRQPFFEKFRSYYNTTLCFMRETEVYLQNQHLISLTRAHQLDRNKLDTNRLVYLAREYFTRPVVLLLSLMKNNYSVIVTSISRSPQTIISLFVSKIKGSKCVLWIEEWFIPRQRSMMSKLSILLTMCVLRNVDAIVVEGTPQYKYVKNFNIPDEKVFFSNHCSLDYSKYRSKNLKEKLNIEKDLLVLYLGRIIERKGLDVLIKAFSKIEQERNDVALMVCGDGDFRPFCEYLAKELKIKHIFFLGSVQEEEIASYYETADLFVLPSCVRENQKIKTEGWGLVINEAMSMAKPIVTTNAVGAAQDLVKNGVNGYVVQNEDVNELYLALKKILEDKELRKAMGKNSRKLFEEFNDFDKMFEGFKKAIKYVIK